MKLKKLKGGKMKLDKSITITTIISLVILLGLWMVLNAVSPNQDTVQVEGVSTITVTPDLITVNFNIETKGDTSAEAKDTNSEIFNKLKDELIVLGFEREEIQTISFNVYPDYIWEDGERIDNGFRATHVVKVEMSVEELDLSNEVVDAGVEAGAGISYINFELTSESQSKYKAEAMKLAAQDAAIKAEAVAEGFDKNVGKLVSVTISDFGYYPWRAYSGGLAEDTAQIKEAVANIQPSDQEISASVRATYKLR